MLKELKIGGITISVPIIQGGMGVGISLSGLAVAVANQGGVGVISAAGLGFIHHNSSLDYLMANLEGLKKEIRTAKEKTKGVIGVNIMVAMSNFADLVKTAISEKVDIIFSGAGLPLDLPALKPEGSHTCLVPIVSSARAAKVICEKWSNTYNYLPDAIVVEGPKAGGHLGFKREDIDNEEFSLERLIPQVVSQVKVYEEKFNCQIPVIAAGGIYDGKDIFEIMQRGAKGVQLGTRFVTTHECDAYPGFKKAYIDAQETDIEIIQSPVGMPGRAIKSDFIKKVNEGKNKPVKCPFHCIRTCKMETSPYCIVSVLYNAYKGNLKNGYAFAGSNAFKATEIVSVETVFKELIEEYNQCEDFTNSL